MAHALTIALLLGCVIFVSVIAGAEMFVEEPPKPPSNGRPAGGRDPSESYVPPVHSIRPVMHDPYGIPEHEFADGQIASNVGTMTIGGSEVQGTDENGTVSEVVDTNPPAVPTTPAPAQSVQVDAEPLAEDVVAAESAPIRTGNITMDALLAYMPTPPQI